MTIAAQDALPEIKLHMKDEDGLKELTLAEWAKDKKVVLFAVPGAFTPTCSARVICPVFLTIMMRLNPKVSMPLAVYPSMMPMS